jgi:hypothetical protein
VSTIEHDAEPEREKLETGPTADDKVGRAVAVPAQKRAQVYTRVAHQAVNAAELLNLGLHKKTIGARDPRHIEVSEPSGPSTGGGKRARQSITLVPISGEGGVLMCGWLDVAHKLADVRSYDEVAEQYKQRFGSRFEPTAHEYERLMDDLRGMVEQLGFRLIEEEEEDEAGPGRGKAVRVLAAVLAAAVVAAVIMLLR